MGVVLLKVVWGPWTRGDLQCHIVSMSQAWCCSQGCNVEGSMPLHRTVQGVKLGVTATGCASAGALPTWKAEPSCAAAAAWAENRALRDATLSPSQRAGYDNTSSSVVVKAI